MKRREFLACFCGSAVAVAGCVSSNPGPAATPTASAPVRRVWNGNGSLREYYLHGKYPQDEIDAVADMISVVFKKWDTSQQQQMLAEILAFHHVVFHPNNNHDIRQNHKVITQYKPLLEKMCKKHDVPFLPVLAITSWENSGGSNVVSWADAAGLGMMTQGAVDEAHRYAARKAAALKEKKEFEKASVLNVAQRHRKMAKEAGVKDERAIAACNLEDVVLFFDFLLSQYGGRVDHAIAAYHKGVLNHDDILYDYIRRRDPNVFFPQGADRSSFLQALEQQNVSYVDLWNDARSREMLNGLRTVEGERTTSKNKHMALGDESDIYPWKVLGSLSALRAGEAHLTKLVERYSMPQLAGEVRGLPAYLGGEGRREGSNQGYLVEFPASFWKGDIQDSRQAWIRPEMAGYLMHLHARVGRALGGGWKIPIAALGRASKGREKWEQDLHSKGVAVRIAIGDMKIEARDYLNKVLQQDYLFDRIYLRSSRDYHHLVVNPRFGHEFMTQYRERSGAAPAR